MSTVAERNRVEWELYLAWLKDDHRLYDELAAARERGSYEQIETAMAATAAHLRTLVVPKGAKPEDL